MPPTKISQLPNDAAPDGGLSYTIIVNGTGANRRCTLSNLLASAAADRASTTFGAGAAISGSVPTVACNHATTGFSGSSGALNAIVNGDNKVLIGSGGSVVIQSTGSAGAPVLRFGNNSNSGLWGSTSLYFATNGVNRMLIGSGGTVVVETAGTAAGPAFRVGGSVSTTGLYASAADNLDVAASGVQQLNISSDGVTVTGNTLRIATAKTPASSTEPILRGTLCWDANYLYLSVGLNQWKRIPLSTF